MRVFIFWNLTQGARIQFLHSGLYAVLKCCNCLRRVTLAEGIVRPFVLGRKNWLFAGTPEGAEASALLYSLIETAKANKLEPYAYLRYIFEKLPVAATLEDYEALLPWNLTPEQMAAPVVVQCA